MVDVSIIIPMYNERENLKKLIPSIAENSERILVKGFKESDGKCSGVVDADLQHPSGIH